MENLNKTEAIVKDIIKKLEEVKKSDDSVKISNLERECVRAAQIAQMQFGYITRDIYNVVSRRRAELRDKAIESITAVVDEAISGAEPVAEAPKVESKKPTKKAAKKPAKKAKKESK